MEKNRVKLMALSIGAAGIVGSVTYLALTSWIRLSTQLSLYLISALPVAMLLAFTFLMSKPHRPQMVSSSKNSSRNSEVDGLISLNPDTKESLRIRENSFSSFPTPVGGQNQSSIKSASEAIVIDEKVSPHSSRTSSIDHDDEIPVSTIRVQDLPLRERLALARLLIIPYMMPLFLVYFAEYTINMGIAPTILYPLDNTPFHELRDAFVYYQVSNFFLIKFYYVILWYIIYFD